MAPKIKTQKYLVNTQKEALNKIVYFYFLGCRNANTIEKTKMGIVDFPSIKLGNRVVAVFTLCE
jgi:hypothetical protein